MRVNDPAASQTRGSSFIRSDIGGELGRLERKGTRRVKHRVRDCQVSEGGSKQLETCGVG